MRSRAFDPVWTPAILVAGDENSSFDTLQPNSKHFGTCCVLETDAYSSTATVRAATWKFWYLSATGEECWLQSNGALDVADRNRMFKNALKIVFLGLLTLSACAILLVIFAMLRYKSPHVKLPHGYEVSKISWDLRVIVRSADGTISVRGNIVDFELRERAKVYGQSDEEGIILWFIFDTSTGATQYFPTELDRDAETNELKRAPPVFQRR